MALRLRRGTDAQRGTITPAEGELIFTTDTKKIYAGDGTTVGGRIVSGINNVLEDITPQLGGNLDTNNKDILGTGNINITGNITASRVNLNDPDFAKDLQDDAKYCTNAPYFLKRLID